MKRYRFHDGNPSIFRTLFHGEFYRIGIFFICWNIFGFGAYSLARSGAREKDPGFDNKPHTHQFLDIMGFNRQQMKNVKVNISREGIKTTVEKGLLTEDEKFQRDNGNT